MVPQDNSERNEKPKIIVDDDWKTRVQAEKEALRAAAGPGEGPSQPGPAAESRIHRPGAEPPQRPAPEQRAEEPYPPASFELLVSLLVTQALAALGQIPLGEKQEPMINLDHAKHAIDLLGVLEEKTKGNLTASESAMLTRLLDELRMIYVAMRNQLSH